MSGPSADWTALMRQARRGDAAAYDRCLRGIARALRPLVRRGLERAGRGAADTEDVVQEILIAVHLKGHTWDETRPFAPWLYAVARYKLIDALRRRGVPAHVPIEAVIDILPAEDAGEPALRSDLDRALDALPQRQNAVVRAIAVEGAGIGETAARLGVSEGAVRVALHRGLAALGHRGKDRR
ncbi:MAG: sigma-70 family RNA polymerase sigma factor [Pseudorhodoplanes sp.]